MISFFYKMTYFNEEVTCTELSSIVSIPWLEYPSFSASLIFGNVIVCRIESTFNPLELCSFHFPGRLCWPGALNKDPTV